MAYKPLINIKNLSLSYLDKNLFENLSFSVGRGEIVALIGANGCGKTTLLDFILAVYANETETRKDNNLIIKGELYLAPKARLAYLPQTFRRDFPGETGHETEPASPVYQRLLEEFSLTRVNEREKFAWEKSTEKEKRIFLSEGERQKKAIAAVFGRRADMLLFDEPSGGLSERGSFRTLMQPDITLRCDLHPRWSRNGGFVIFDSTHEGTRQVYRLPIDDR